MKNLTLAQATSSEKSIKLKMIKESKGDDLLVIQQQQAMFNDATLFNSLTHDLRQLSSDASRNRNRSGNRSDNHESRKGSESAGRSTGKAKQSSCANGNVAMQNETRPTTTTTLAISFSSPNLATNSSFSSSSDSSEFDLACGVSSIVKIQNMLDDGFIDENDTMERESLNLAGENDVEYAELTQRMTPPSQKAQHKSESAAMEESDLNLLTLFDASSGSPRNTETESSSCNSPSSGSSRTSIRPASSVLPVSNFYESSGAPNELASLNAYAGNFDLPSDLNQEAAHSLPPEISCTSPVWKPVWADA